VLCVGSDLPDPTACVTFRFRGTNSSDPDNDIASWSIAFGDGTSTAGSRTADAPADVAHTYASDGFYTAELTVTDAAGHASSDTITFSMDTDGPTELHADRSRALWSCRWSRSRVLVTRRSASSYAVRASAGRWESSSRWARTAW
jgi:PKD repeat protein